MLTKIQAFVAKWRPSPNPHPRVFYVQPGWAKSTDEQAGEALSLLDDLRIDVEEDENEMRKGSGMKVFISHSSADRGVAQSLIELIRSALNVNSKEIRCTSVDGYKLAAGADANEQLRVEVFECQVFIALLSPESFKSVYVMFELGARWGAKKYMAPILVKDMKAGELKAPISAIHAINGSSEADMQQFVEELARRLGVEAEKPGVYGKALKAFSEKSSSWLL